MYVKEANACSSWYGFPPEQAGDVRKITTPLQLHLAEKDQASARRGPGRKLLRGKGLRIPWYDAGHAFFNEK
jgi:dienelactone hydrolase